MSVHFFFYRWYFGKIKRIEAEKKLLLPENEHGAFLIRDSESRRDDYSLSGRSWMNLDNRESSAFLVFFHISIIAFLTLYLYTKVYYGYDYLGSSFQINVMISLVIMVIMK